MKTIKQIADEIGVSKTAVRKYLTDEVKTKFAQTVSGIIYIDEQGETLIKSAVVMNRPQTKFAEVSANQPEPVFGQTANQFAVVSTLIDMLQSELEAKNKQLEAKDSQLAVKDKQIEELTTAIRLQAESINADRKNELAGTLIDGQQKLISDKAAELEEEKPKKKSFFSFWKR